VLKVKFQNLGENQAEAHFKWDNISGDYMPIEETNNKRYAMGSGLKKKSNYKGLIQVINLAKSKLKWSKILYSQQH
jgi:hypothetical protein